MRTWTPKDDNGCVHCIGNGRICVYEEGPQIIQIFGAPYSAPIFASASLTDVTACTSRRVFRSAVWEHTLPQGTITDLADSESCSFIRCVDAKETITMELSIEPYFDLMSQGDILVYSTRPGAPVYAKYVAPVSVSNGVAVSGNAQITARSDHQLTIVFSPGQSFLFITGGPEYHRCLTEMEQLIRLPYEEIKERTVQWWHTFLDRMADVPASVRDLAEDIAVLIKTQQAQEGAVLAGYNYHLGYVRDQYGVSRGLLKLGYYEEAKAILNFYFRLWKKFGYIRNAQAAGFDNIFHVHENDEVEITGYLTVQIFDYYKRTNDKDFLEEVLPMAKWAIEAQLRNQKNGMLPFNGDETYIAGGILPRYTMYDGSMEATLLLLQSIKLYEGYTKDMTYHSAMEEIEKSYRSNFMPEGRLITNNPKRLDHSDYPRFRYGICEQCCSHFDLEKTKGGRYLCPKCFQKYKKGELPEMDLHPGKVFSILSTAFTPIYIGNSFAEDPSIDEMVDTIVRRYKETGSLPSRPDADATVGYDYGMFLYCLTKKKHPLAAEICRLTLSVLDPVNAWVEYYRNGIPYNTRYRPWESAINMEAVLTFLEANPDADLK